MLQFKRRLCRSVIALAVLLGVFAAGFSLGGREAGCCCSVVLILLVSACRIR